MDKVEYNRNAFRTGERAVTTILRLREDYWETFEVGEEDIEFLYQHLLEVERPLPPEALAEALVAERLRREREALDQRRAGDRLIYLPKEHYQVGDRLIFPVWDWAQGEVVAVRPGRNPDVGPFEVIRVRFADGRERELAAGLAEHRLNEPPRLAEDDPLLSPQGVLARFGDRIVQRLEEALSKQDDFVRIAGRWFPRALLMEVNIGHLNLAEAVLDMAGGGPLPTRAIMEQIEYPLSDNPHLAEFSFDLALQEDERFDEVGPAGQVLWFLKRLEPEGVLETPRFLRYDPLDYDRSVLTDDMLALEAALDDELSPLSEPPQRAEAVEVTLIYPHWRAGTLPLTGKVRHLFPTAYEAPRIRFMLVDGETGETFPGWVVRQARYVYGLREWYEAKGLLPGSMITVRRGAEPGQVIVEANTKRTVREWVRTVLVGSDDRVGFRLLQQRVNAGFDERMLFYILDVEAMDRAWDRIHRDRVPLEKLLVSVMRELMQATSQPHVHAAELYAALNLLRRCPPGPILALLASRPWFVHVGDLYYRLRDSELE